MLTNDALEPGSDADGVRAALAGAAGRVRHPGLRLVHFVGSLDVQPDDDEEPPDDVIPAGEREPARLRRAALLVAALDVVDQCIDDLQQLAFGDDGRPEPGDAEGSFAYEWFPRRHRGTYDEGFFRKVMVTAVKVAGDLADPNGGPPSCTAEEIIRHATGVIASGLCEQAGLGSPWLDPDEVLLEDADFEYLYDDDMDGLEDDPATQAALGVDVVPIADWFTPFNDTRVVHPYVETSRSSAVLRDLLQRLGEHDPAVVLAGDITDAAAPIASLAPGSTIVALVRSAGAGDRGLWIPDDSDREGSFAGLVTASSAHRGSGWLHWEPHEGAGTIRVEQVIELVPHRHFPIEQDEPWVLAALGTGRMLGVPLRFVVSYRPDPAVREHWQQASSSLLP